MIFSVNICFILTLTNIYLTVLVFLVIVYVGLITKYRSVRSKKSQTIAKQYFKVCSNRPSVLNSSRINCTTEHAHLSVNIVFPELFWLA